MGAIVTTQKCLGYFMHEFDNWGKFESRENDPGHCVAGRRVGGVAHVGGGCKIDRNRIVRPFLKGGNNYVSDGLKSLKKKIDVEKR